ncbi:beta-propeller fold lactonase family protein [Pseudoroseomonas wenyumeiae]
MRLCRSRPSQASSTSSRNWTPSEQTGRRRNADSADLLAQRHPGPAAAAGRTLHAETILVSNEKDNSITVLDGATLEVTRTVPVGERPRGIALSTDGRYLFVCVGDSDRIDVLDLNSWRVVQHLPSGSDPELLAVHPDGRRLYVANEDDNLVTVVDVEQRAVLTEIPVGVEPEDGAEPRWPLPGQYLRNHQHGAFHRYREPGDHRQCHGGLAPARGGLAGGWEACLGVGRDRRHHQRD